MSVNLASVTSADVSLVQLLVSARRAAERRRLPFTLTAVSDVVVAAFEAAGVSWSAFAATAGEA